VTGRSKLIRSVGVLALLAVVLAGCGGGGKKEKAAGGGQANTGKTFPELKIAIDPPDYLDPGLSYTVEGWSTMWRVYLGLLTYNETPGPAGAQVVPALAESLPKVSNDGKTYTLTLRKGLVYSDGTPVKASDFEYAIKRLFLVSSPGVGFYEDIVGAKQFEKTKKGDISGITADDASGKITINLELARGDFTNILAMEFASLVPQDTPAKDQSTTPIPATGPYMIQNYRPNRSFVVVRNPKFKPVRGVPRGNPDKVSFTITDDDVASYQKAVSGQVDYDFLQVPTDRLQEAQSKYGDRLKIYTPANTYYLFVNTRTPPFDKLEARQAVSYAIDREALVRLYGGLATPTENVLPPTYPQYKKITMYTHDLAKAKQLIKSAGATGASVTVWGNSDALSRKTAEYTADVLNSIGLKAKPKILDAGVYWTTIGNQKTNAQIGFADWYQDYPHPLDWFEVLLYGPRITETHNNNYSNADDPQVNKMIADLKEEPTLSKDVNDRWAEVDKRVAEQALWVPYLNLQATAFYSARFDTKCHYSHVLYQVDWYLACLK
jgi:peptide/nickel transport system substrate-binding protein